MQSSSTCPLSPVRLTPHQCCVCLWIRQRGGASEQRVVLGTTAIKADVVMISRSNALDSCPVSGMRQPDRVSQSHFQGQERVIQYQGRCVCDGSAVTCSSFRHARPPRATTIWFTRSHGVLAPSLVRICLLLTMFEVVIKSALAKI